MKEIIKSNLENLFNKNFNSFIKISFPVFIDSITGKNTQAFDFKYPMEGFFEPEDIAALEQLKGNKKLIELYDKLKENLKSNTLIMDGFKKDILNSIMVIKQRVKEENKGFKSQIIFIEHDYDPTACFCGFGEGIYPILETPKYIDFNYKEELFNGIGQISYAPFWKEKIEFEELLSVANDGIDMADLLFSTEIYENIESAYRMKTYLFLYEAFDQISIEAFEGIPLKLPLYIYGNEHDCEQMNVYLYE